MEQEVGVVEFVLGSEVEGEVGNKIGASVSDLGKRCAIWVVLLILKTCFLEVVGCHIPLNMFFIRFYGSLSRQVKIVYLIGIRGQELGARPRFSVANFLLTSVGLLGDSDTFCVVLSFSKCFHLVQCVKY